VKEPKGISLAGERKFGIVCMATNNDMACYCDSDGLYKRGLRVT